MTPPPTDRQGLGERLQGLRLHGAHPFLEGIGLNTLTGTKLGGRGVIPGESNVHPLVDGGFTRKSLDTIRLDLTETATPVSTHEDIIRSGHSDFKQGY
jgi:hypothetical protein